MDIFDALTKVVGLLVLGIPSAILIRNSIIERRAKKFDLYERAADELLERDETVTNMRALREQDFREREGMRQQIELLTRDSNTQARRTRLLMRAVSEAKADAADYKTKWEATTEENKQLRREIRILRTAMERSGTLTPELEVMIQAELDNQPIEPSN